MKSETLDTLGGAFLLTIAVSCFAYMLFVWSPERERFLMATHDCFVQQGGNDLIGEDGAHLEVWQNCAETTRTRFQRDH